VATRPTGPRSWPPHARKARDETLTDIGAARPLITATRKRHQTIRELVAQAKQHLRDPRLLALILDDILAELGETDLADVQTLLADSEKRLELSKHGVD
jgi:hypothetical protein